MSIVCKITIVKFTVFNSDSTDRDKEDRGLIEKPFYNKTAQQCVDEIRQKIWETAQIKSIVEYDVMSDGIRQVDVTAIIDSGPDHSKNRGGEWIKKPSFTNRL